MSDIEAISTKLVASENAVKIANKVTEYTSGLCKNAKLSKEEEVLSLALSVSQLMTLSYLKGANKEWLFNILNGVTNKLDDVADKATKERM
jgi:hypothetical protein